MPTLADPNRGTTGFLKDFRDREYHILLKEHDSFVAALKEACKNFGITFNSNDLEDTVAKLEQKLGTIEKSDDEDGYSKSLAKVFEPLDARTSHDTIILRAAAKGIESPSFAPEAANMFAIGELRLSEFFKALLIDKYIKASLFLIEEKRLDSDWSRVKYYIEKLVIRNLKEEDFFECNKSLDVKTEGDGLPIRSAAELHDLSSLRTDLKNNIRELEDFIKQMDSQVLARIDKEEQLKSLLCNLVKNVAKWRDRKLGLNIEASLAMNSSLSGQTSPTKTLTALDRSLHGTRFDPTVLDGMSKAELVELVKSLTEKSITPFEEWYDSLVVKDDPKIQPVLDGNTLVEQSSAQKLTQQYSRIPDDPFAC